MSTAKSTTAETTTETVPTVHQAWTNVMRHAESLSKDQRYDGGDGGGKFNFRGIDDVMNLVGPILRAEGVSIIPMVTYANYRDVTTRGGKLSREVTVRVDYTITGPAGDTMHGSAPGESMDTGDKGTAKAMSVAYRVFLLQSLCLPTNEPDPDSQVYERANAKPTAEVAQDTADRVPTAVSVPQLQGVKSWAAERNLLDINVNDAQGNSRPLLAVIDEKLAELAPPPADDKDKHVSDSLGGA